MIAAFTKSVAQLSDPAFRRVLGIGVSITVAVFVVLLVAAWYGIGALAAGDAGFFGVALQFGGFFVVLVVLFLLFPALATLGMSLFLDDIVDAVERRHYAHEAMGRPLGLGPALVIAARFTAVVVGLNLVALPLYLVPGINLFIFYGLNGYLLSREYFELVALRHLDLAAATALRKDNRARLLIAGIVITFLLTIPVVNIIAPILAAAFMAHVFKGLSGRPTGQTRTQRP